MDVGIPTQVLVELRDELRGAGYDVECEWSKARGRGEHQEDQLLYKLLLKEVGYEVFFVEDNGVDKLTVQDLFMKRKGTPTVALSVALDDPRCFERLFEVLGRSL